MATIVVSSLRPHVGKILLAVIAGRHSDYFEPGGVLHQEQCGFRPQRSKVDIFFAVRRL